MDNFSIKNNIKLNRKGLTLVELLVVVAMVGVLGTVTIASFNKYSNQQAVSQAALSVKAMIEKAKFGAVSRIKPSDPQCTAADPLERYEFDVQSNNDYRAMAVCNGHRVQTAKETLPGNITINRSPCKAHFYVYYGTVDWGTPNGSSSVPPGSPGSLSFSGQCRTNGVCGPNKFCIRVQGYGVTKTIFLDEGGNVNIQ